MTKTNTTRVHDKYPPTRAGRVHPPPPDHAGSIPGLVYIVNVNQDESRLKLHFFPPGSRRNKSKTRNG